MKSKILCLVLVFSLAACSERKYPFQEDDNGGGTSSPSQYPQVIAPATAYNHGGIVTHWLSSGTLRIGIARNGGGVINQVELDGLKIMGSVSQSYGRCGQSSMRDSGHSGRYNPTQAGFNETLGTPCTITQSEGMLTVEPRMCSLWHGDSQYDYTEWENIGADPYKDDNPVQGHGSDWDQLDESALPGKQLEEVGSEFDYYGTYEDFRSKGNVQTPVIRHYYEYRFIREPGHCMSQFFQGTMENGQNVLNPDMFEQDISVEYPEGVYPGTKYDMNGNISAWSIRNDLALWSPEYRYVQRQDGTWEVMQRTKVWNVKNDSYKWLFIVAESDNPDQGRALGFYRPNTEINRYPIVGVREATGEIVYKDARATMTEINEQPQRTKTMSWMGFKHYVRGILNRTRLTTKYPGVYEAYRAEYYIFYGTPDEIKAAVEALDATILQ